MSYTLRDFVEDTVDQYWMKFSVDANSYCTEDNDTKEESGGEFGGMWSCSVT